jgi:hypothetical protein
MEIVFQFILVAGVLKYSSKATFFDGYRGIWLYSLIGGAIAMASYPIILHTDSDFFAKLMSDKGSVSNIAVVITIEAIAGMFISIGMLHNLFAAKTNKWISVLKLIPGVLIIGIVFYTELMLFRAMAGISFHWIAITASISVMMATALLSLMLKYVLPDISTRYEMKFLLNLLLLILAVLLNASLADYNTGHYRANTGYTKLLVFVGLAIAGFLVGWLLYRYKRTIHKILKFR